MDMGAYPSSSNAMLCCCPQAICTIFLSSKPLTRTATAVSIRDPDLKKKFKILTRLAFNIEPSSVSGRNMFSRTPVAELALLSTPRRVYCEAGPLATDSGTAQKRSSRALSAHSEEQRECDASCSGDDVLLFAGFWMKRSVHKLKCADLRAGWVTTLQNWVSGCTRVITEQCSTPGQEYLALRSKPDHYYRREQNDFSRRLRSQT